uniref:Uncharacterized protein n=1 Tax=Arundo donax TaxID=35708 RepID=A0A0A8ZT17_ARUDO
MRLLCQRSQIYLI